MNRLLVSVAAMSLVLVACTSPTDPAAIVDGVEISFARLDSMNIDGEIDDEERASSLFLLVLHQILSAGASEDFGFVASEAQVDAAFGRRAGESDVDERLARRGETRERVRVEAALDVIRDEIEEALVREDDSGFDFDRAYRGFLASNSRVCLVVLNLADAVLVDDIQSRVDAGEDLDAIFELYPDRTARLDMGCRSPIEHGPELAPVALDGEVGVSYARPTSGDAIYVAKVTERDAPAAEDVRELVILHGVETQGPELFNAWAVEQMTSARVEIADQVGTWEPGPLSEDVPTVVAN